MLKVYTDASVDPATKLAGVGILIIDKDIHAQKHFSLEGEWENHKAEMAAILIACQFLLKKQLQNHIIFLYTDSKVSYELWEQEYTNNDDFTAILDSLLKLKEKFPLLTIEWIPESENRGADNLARQGLRKALKEQ